ncbi:acyltransferase [Acuticoccus sp. M5D2P5]|nr:acyltransferase [Acuticoccus kalidii]
MPVAYSVQGSPLLRYAYLYVDFFFVLSGFVMSFAFSQAITTRTMLPFIVRRFGRLWPLHASIILGFVLIEALLLLAPAPPPGEAGAKIPFTGAFSLDLLAQQLLFLDGFGLSEIIGWNIPSWSISAEFWVCVLFALVFAAFRKQGVVVMGGLGAVAGLVIVAFADGTMDTNIDLGFVRCVYGFAAGCVTFAIYRRRQDAWSNSAVEIAMVVAALLYVWAAGPNVWGYAAPLVFSVVIYVFAVSTDGIVSRLLRARWLQTIGERSYSIYLIHSLVIYLMLIVCTGIERRTSIEIIGAVPGQVIPVIDAAGPYALWVNNAITAFYVFLVVYLAGVTYRRIEVPTRNFFNRIAGRVRPVSDGTGGIAAAEAAAPVVKGGAAGR